MYIIPVYGYTIEEVCIHRWEEDCVIFFKSSLIAEGEHLSESPEWNDVLVRGTNLLFSHLLHTLIIASDELFDRNTFCQKHLWGVTLRTRNNQAQLVIMKQAKFATISFARFSSTVKQLVQSRPESLKHPKQDTFAGPPCSALRTELCGPKMDCELLKGASR